jgi:hypothetical protein
MSEERSLHRYSLLCMWNGSDVMWFYQEINFNLFWTMPSHKGNPPVCLIVKTLSSRASNFFSAQITLQKHITAVDKRIERVREAQQSTRSSHNVLLSGALPIHNAIIIIVDKHFNWSGGSRASLSLRNVRVMRWKWGRNIVLSLSLLRWSRARIIGAVYGVSTQLQLTEKEQSWLIKYENLFAY